MYKILPILTIIALLFLPTCKLTQNLFGPETEVVNTPAIEVIDEPEEDRRPRESFVLNRSDLAREVNPNVDSGQIDILAVDNTTFAFYVYDQIRSAEENFIFSPFSLSMALSMALAGAENATEQEMLAALQMSLPENDVHAAFNALMLSIESSQAEDLAQSETEQFKLNIANSIWCQPDYKFEQTFLDTLAQNYGSGIFSINFIQNPEGARLAINDWVSDETEKNIEEIIPEDAITSSTRLVLANAIYFYGSWSKPFKTNATSDAPFYKLDGSEITVDMMKLYDEYLAYGWGENYQAVELPYLRSDFVMTILVPEKGEFNAFEAQLNQDQLSQILANMSKDWVDLKLPKFDFESNIPAKGNLKSLGMNSAFSEADADFSGITGMKELFISDVLHKATITVDEGGTEAAAATVIVFDEVTSAIVEDYAILLVVDRPFIFMIRHVPTNTILFLGRVLEP